MVIVMVGVMVKISVMVRVRVSVRSIDRVTADLQYLPLQRVQKNRWGQKDKFSRDERGYRMAVLTE